MSDTATITEAVPLVAEDLAAFKLADEVSLHTSAYWGGSRIRLYVHKFGDPIIFTAKQQTLFPAHFSDNQRVRDLHVSASVMGYSDRSGDENGSGWQWPTWGEREPMPACFSMHANMAIWSTIVRSLRVGSLLSIQWTADNNNDLVRAASLHVDEVALTAVTGKRTDTWKIATNVCAHNTARMIQRG